MILIPRSVQRSKAVPWSTEVRMTDPRGKLLKFSLPVADGAEWTDDKEGTGDTLFNEMGKEGNALEGFAKTHFVGENTVETVGVEGEKPFDTDLLVWS